MAEMALPESDARPGGNSVVVRGVWPYRPGPASAVSRVLVAHKSATGGCAKPLQKAGLRFRDFFLSNPNCSPSPLTPNCRRLQDLF